MRSVKPGEGRGELRRRAEEHLRAEARGATPPEATEDLLRLIHELQVHQVELEMQNEELRRARDDLEAISDRYVELYDFAPVGYLTLDEKGDILEINLVGAAMLGKERARVLGQRLASWVTAGTRPVLHGVLSRLQLEARASGDVALAGGKEPLFVHVDAVRDAPSRDAVWRCRATLTDVTEQKASDRRKAEFLAVLSHELRNPLTPIANAIEVLDHVPAGSARAAEAQAVLHRQTRQLGRLVDDLLDLTRISSGKVALQLEVVDLLEVARRTRDDHRALFEQRGVDLRLDEPAEPPFVQGDAIRLAQVLGNLLHNAAKFTPAGGRTDVEVRAVGERVELRVRDSGRGIEPCERGRLFEPFAQVHRAAPRNPGLGLGLWLSKGLVELHGGTLAVSSQGAGRGTEFVITLPRVPHPGTAAPARPARPPPRSVVIIDDNEDAASTLAEILSLQGHEVAVALDGKSGVELVRRARPDIVFCDIGLPDLDGYEVARTLRADEALGATRLVALSGYAQPEDRERAREAGFSSHLAKPPDLDAVNHLLAGRP